MDSDAKGGIPLKEVPISLTVIGSPVCTVKHHLQEIAVELSPSMLNTQGGPRRNEKRPDHTAQWNADSAALQRR